MKAFKSVSGTFGVLECTSSGTYKNAQAEGYTSADDIKVSSIYTCSNSSGSARYLSGLPEDTTGCTGFLITLMYDGSNGAQFFVHTNKSTSTPYYPMRLRMLSSASWGTWRRCAEFTEVTV